MKPVKICFGHIGGKLGKLLMEYYEKQEWIKKDDTSEKHFIITKKGEEEFTKLGIDLSKLEEK